MSKKLSERIRGVKVLSLQKQHYLDEYTQNLDCAYSCWGYYDGMDIIDVLPGESSLFEKKSRSAISDIWYQIGKKVSDLNGTASQQNIGIFRAEEGEEEFWNEGKRKIFLTVCFVQLKNWEDAIRIGKEIEEQKDHVVDILSYYTFDNADLVIFLQSNSYKGLMEKIIGWKNNTNILYVHTINGVREESLKQVNEQNKNIVDAAGNALANDYVAEVQMDIVVKGSNFENIFKELFVKCNKSFTLKNFKKIRCAQGAGHGSYTFSWFDTDMQSVLYLLLPKGIGTHLNGLFGKLMYNMETKIYLEQNSFENLKSIEMDDEEKEEKYQKWCSIQIDEYKKYMSKAWKEKDEGFYSYCKAIIQTLNMLSQYENFRLSNKIFHMIYPAFQLFSEQLKEAKNEEKKKDAIREFSEAVNSIVYHAIHTDQIFLMIPGYSGTSFSIPTKLSLFYLWYLEKISEILKDDEYQYQFFLTPVMETRPYTNTIDFGLPVGNRLISVKISQRSLYMPRTLLIILAHETAHYVGMNFRNREKRLDCLIRTLGHMVAEGIFPYFLVESEEEQKRKKDISVYAINKICDYLKLYVKNQNFAEKYHASFVKSILKRACAIVLADENKEIYTILQKEIDKSGSFNARVERMEKIQKKAEYCEKRRIQLLGSGQCSEIVEYLLKLYQEVFSDIVAKEILAFDEKDYNAAFDISEGMVVNEMSGFGMIRKKMIIEKMELQNYSNLLNEKLQEKELIEYWTALDVVEGYLKKYVEKCKQDIEEYFNVSEGKKEKIEEIQTIMRMFSNDENSWKEIYSAVITKAEEYSRKVEEEYEK